MNELPDRPVELWRERNEHWLRWLGYTALTFWMGGGIETGRDFRVTASTNGLLVTNGRDARFLAWTDIAEIEASARIGVFAVILMTDGSEVALSEGHLGEASRTNAQFRTEVGNARLLKLKDAQALARHASE